MRRPLCALLLSCVLGVAGLTAAELTTAQAQQLVSAAQNVQPGKEGSATLAIAGKDVGFTVTRDAVGTAIARPVPGPDSKDIDIAQVTIQFTSVPNGTLTPTTVVLISNSQNVVSYVVQLNQDGTIASIYQPGGLGGGGGPSKPKPVVGGIGSSEENSAGGRNAWVRRTDLEFFRRPTASLPPGTKSGEASRSHP